MTLFDLITARIWYRTFRKVSAWWQNRRKETEKNRQTDTRCSHLSQSDLSNIVYNVLKSSRPPIGAFIVSFTAETSFVFVDVTFRIGVIFQNQIPPSTKWFVFVCTVHSVLLLFDYRIMSFHKTKTSICVWPLFIL